jgi:hypothetical protein
LTVLSRLPVPPPDLDRRDLPIATVPPVRIYRIHRTEYTPVWFGPGPDKPPAYRFDAPAGEFGVCYFGRTPEASFAETFLRQPPVRLISMQDLASRSLATFRLARSVRLVSLNGPGLAQLGATAEIASGDYSLSRAWALALWKHPSAPDGLMYRCRHDDDSFAVALFDRAADAVTLGASSPLHLQQALVGWLSRRYRFGLVP